MMALLIHGTPALKGQKFDSTPTSGGTFESSMACLTSEPYDTNVRYFFKPRGTLTVGKILVTGASGDIGRKTLLHLLKLRPANELIGLVRDPAKAEDLTAKGIELRKGDYLDTASLAEGSTGVDKIMLTATH